MKNLLLGLSLILAGFTFGQAQEKGAISINADYDAGLHFLKWHETVTFGSVTVEDRDTSAALTHMFRFDGHYNIFKFLSAGLHFRGGSYVESQEEDEADGNSVFIYGAGLRLYPVNTDHFVLYAGASFGYSNLKINRLSSGFNTPYRYKFAAPHFGFDLGFHVYFTENIGMNIAMGYTRQNFDLKEWTIDGDVQSQDNHTLNLLSQGVHFNIGVAATFGGN